MIRKNTPATEQEFKKMDLLKDGIYKRLEFSIQNVIDIFSIIYKEENLGIPSSLDGILIKIAEKEIFPNKIMTLIQKMKGLRNLLIHRYGDIDDALVYEFITKDQLNQGRLFVSS